MENNIIIEEVEFSHELYEKNLNENIIVSEYDGGVENANN